MIGGHHVSKKFWMPYIGEELPLSCKEGNVYDKHAVAVYKADGIVVGHNTPREIDVACLLVFPATRRYRYKLFYASTEVSRNSFYMTATFSLAHAFDV